MLKQPANNSDLLLKYSIFASDFDPYIHVIIVRRKTEKRESS